MTQKPKFVHNWISNLMRSMDKHLDENKKIEIMEECGRVCAQNNTKKEALKYQGQLDAWLIKMKEWIGKENVWQEDNVIKLTYNKCYCPIIQNSQPGSLQNFCDCSRGWLKENFEAVLEGPVEVELEDSIMRGGKQCKFTIYV